MTSNVSSIPSGRLIAKACACESPTTTSRRGRPASALVGVGAAATVVEGWFAGCAPNATSLAAGGPVERIDGGVEGDQGDDDHGDADDGDQAPLLRRPPPPPELAATDRHLDVPVGQLRQHGRDSECDGDPRRRAVVGAGEHEDRPVPQVDAVAALADLDERRPRERTPGTTTQPGGPRRARRRATAASRGRAATGTRSRRSASPPRRCSRASPTATCRSRRAAGRRRDVAAAGDRHGRHTNAAAAPSSSPRPASPSTGT